MRDTYTSRMEALTAHVLVVDDDAEIRHLVSGYLEEIISEKLDAAGVPVPTVLKPRPMRKSAAEAEEIVSQHFTF